MANTLTSPTPKDVAEGLLGALGKAAEARRVAIETAKQLRPPPPPPPPPQT